MDLNRKISTQAGVIIIGVLSAALIGLILFSWNWAGNYLASIVSNM